MPANDQPPERNASAEVFEASLKRRRQSAEGLEQDLLTEVPLLYGSAKADPGIELARIHREEMVRRNGGGVSSSSGRRSELVLPFEGVTAAVVVLLCLFFLFSG